MAHGRSGAMWAATASVIRAVCLSLTGTEPPLAAFVPNEFLPDDLKHREQTPTEIAKADEYRRKKAELDIRIMTDLANKGKLRRRPGGTNGQRR